MNIDINEITELIRRVKPIITDRTLASKTSEKGLADFVTAVDTSVQEFLKNELAARYPYVQFLGEEGDHERIDASGAVWILDPVDGTTNLVHDYRQSAVSLALADGGEVTAGIVYNPFSEEMFTARKGSGAFLNGGPIRVSRAKHLSDALAAVGTSPYEKERADKNFELFKRVFKASQDIRRSGSAAIDLCSVAAGRIDGYIEQNLKPWDFAAGMLIVHEAGGEVTDYGGGEVYPFKNSDILAGTAGVRAELEVLIRNTL